jgi:hypothetical protein
VGEKGTHVKYLLAESREAGWLIKITRGFPGGVCNSKIEKSRLHKVNMF